MTKPKDLLEKTRILKPSVAVAIEIINKGAAHKLHGRAFRSCSGCKMRGGRARDQRE